MLELSKKILVGVSFDSVLFQKELNKIRKWITDADEYRRLKEWCVMEFGAKYPNIIRRTFYNTTN